MTIQTFGEERAKRYNRALQRCPYARVREIIPILFLLYEEDRRKQTLIDLASGTGYLADALKPLFERSIRVDKSPAFLAASQSNRDLIYADIREVSNILPDTLQVDAVTCLAALHHIYRLGKDKINVSLSDKVQSESLMRWTRLLAPGGKLVLVDVGVPDLQTIGKQNYSLAQSLKYYYEQKQAFFQQKHFSIHTHLFDAINEDVPGYRVKRVIQQLLSTCQDGVVSLASLIKQQNLIYRVLPEKMLTVDFFDEVVANFSIDGHISHFPRESTIQAVLEKSGLENILITCLPTPWVFDTEAEAVWFVRELFGLGEEAVLDPDDLLKRPDFEKIKAYIHQFLGMVTEEGKTYVNWQLLFAYGEKPDK
ncbi:hypothetical protein KSF_075190 [Reticulibacter mediterranei]|uniref:Methyltransferase type 12 domain-containing protein n=1 Tax=Reticulibacter mediterranei TaxID=2778369 RepID=A0A8J3IWR5_9CHLR|nr:methyltransferase [Reticulibacter mediterranei]GHO97471.1 hypothetical protein KSF_075190 [Reticulibacter mediterranei]